MFELILSIFLDYIVLGTGRAAVFIASAGRWRSDLSDTKEGRIFDQGSLIFENEGKTTVSRAGLMLSGSAVYFFVVVTAVIFLAR